MDLIYSKNTQQNFINHHYYHQYTPNHQLELFQDNPFLYNKYQYQYPNIMDFDIHKNTFQNGFLQQKKYQIQKINAHLQTILIIINSVSLFIYYEFSCKNQGYDGYFLMISFISNILIGFFRFLKEKAIDKQQKRNQSSILKNLKIILAILIHPFPWMQGSEFPLYVNKPSIQGCNNFIKSNFILLIIALFRNILMIIPSICFNLYYYQPRSQRIYKIHSHKNNLHLFAIKSIFKDRPYLCIGVVFIITVFYFSFSLRLIERNSTCNNGYFYYYQNSIWFVMITITTIGFGQITVCTTFGYLLTIFSILIGVFNTSLIVVLSVNLFQFNYEEIETFNSLKNQQYKQKYKEKCRKYIRLRLWRLWKKYQYLQVYPQNKEQQKLKVQINIMRKKCKNIIYVNKNQLFNQMENNFSQISAKSQTLIYNNFKILNFLNSIFVQESDLCLSIQSLQNQIKQKQKKYCHSFIMSKIKILAQNQLKDENWQFINRQKIKNNKQKISIKCIDLQGENEYL